MTPPVGAESNVREGTTVTVNVCVPEVYPDLENVRVMSYVPAVVGVPMTFPSTTDSHDAPKTDIVAPDTERLGVYDHDDPDLILRSEGPPETVICSCDHTA